MGGKALSYETRMRSLNKRKSRSESPLILSHDFKQARSGMQQTSPRRPMTANLELPVKLHNGDLVHASALENSLLAHDSMQHNLGSPASLLSLSPMSSAPTMTFSASTASSSLTSLSDVPSTPSDFYPSSQQSVFADIKQWSHPIQQASPADGFHNPNSFYTSPPLSTNPNIMPHYVSPSKISDGGSGSSYRGSGGMDELMSAGMPVTTPPNNISPVHGLGLDSYQQQSPPVAMPQPIYAVAPSAELVSSFAQIYRETRKGQDLGLSLEDLEVLETLGEFI